MKRFNLRKSAIAMSLMVAAVNTQAADVTADITFTTLPEIQIFEEQAISFGEVLSPTSGHTCDVAVDAGTALTAAAYGSDDTPPSVGTLTGECDTSVDGTVGIYRVEAYDNAYINVTLNQGAATDIEFVPDGVLVDYLTGDGASAPVALTEGTAANAYAASDLDDDETSGYVAIGHTRVIVGGLITNATALTVGTEYTTTFDIDILYN